MVARAGGYYGKSFKVFRGGLTQGGLLSPTIFNVVVDAVVWHWVEDMVESAGGQGRCGLRADTLCFFVGTTFQKKFNHTIAV